MGIFSVYARVYTHDPCVEKLDGIESGSGESQSLVGEREKILVNFSEYSGVSR